MFLFPVLSTCCFMITHIFKDQHNVAGDLHSLNLLVFFRGVVVLFLEGLWICVRVGGLLILCSCWHVLNHVFIMLINVKMPVVSTGWYVISGPEVIKLFPCLTQLSTEFILLINVKMPTGILTFISMINATSERLKARNFFICRYFRFYEQLKFRTQWSWAWKSFITSGPDRGIFLSYSDCFLGFHFFL